MNGLHTKLGFYDDSVPAGLVGVSVVSEEACSLVGSFRVGRVRSGLGVLDGWYGHRRAISIIQ